MTKPKSHWNDERLQSTFLNMPDIVTLLLEDDCIYPNNSSLPMIVYKSALKSECFQKTSFVRRIFSDNNWHGSWVDGIHDFHHYHSTAHEVLAIFNGQGIVLMGGETGESLTVKRGDVIIIPAGVSHKNLGASDDFLVIGAYPQGQRPDRCYGEEEERPQADKNIERVPLPDSDPVYGVSGPLMQLWKT